MEEGLTIEEAVVRVFEEAVPEDRGPVTLDATFDDLGVRNIDVITAVIKLETAFGTEAPIEETEFFRQGKGTLKDIVRKLKVYLPEGACVPRRQNKKGLLRRLGF